ncbi:helix-turn-helix domain-containing protein [Paenibacillus caui]|uniref:helix-turn-helix domain-containing protein n=1 Tax=Paenibacillus caui TaxID=2873927 RepID=UPI001CA80AB1|nr:helix-turn-helix domain-containing protein [Paenibacillus caui]
METSEKKPSGLLQVQKKRENFTLALFSPSKDLDLFVEHYWAVDWDLRGLAPQVSENLPHPSVHLVIEPDQCRIVGIVKEKFSYVLKEQGVVFGVKFRPGAFFPFVNVPVSTYTGRSIPAHEVLGAEAADWERAIRAGDDDHERVAITEAFLRGRMPAVQDETISLITTIVDTVRADRAMKTVDDLASRFHLTTRMLQRMFSKYVGISPKWVIGRYRLLEVADQLAHGQPANWPQLAAELGYYDQSHFIKDFKCIVGLSPEEYIRKNAEAKVNSD